MIVTETRHDVYTKDRDALARWMRRRRVSVRELAFRVSTRKRTWSRGTIGNIRSGHQRYVDSDLADLIAEYLDVPWEEIFTDRSSTVQREVGRSA